jgi:hypothetical protein
MEGVDLSPRHERRFSNLKMISPGSGQRRPKNGVRKYASFETEIVVRRTVAIVAQR